MSDEITALGLLVGVLTGIAGTVVAEVLRLRRKPRLSLALVDGLSGGLIAGHRGAYARLDVRNAKRRDGAVNVTVRIQHVRAHAADDTRDLDALQRWQLAWANEDRGNPNVPPEPKPVPGGDTRGIDLAHINSKVPGALIVDVRPQPERGNHFNRLGAGTYTFELVVSGDNARARRYAVDLAYDGEPWDGGTDTAADRLRLLELQRL